MVIEPLDVPVTIQTPFGSATLTHRAWGHTHQPWADPPLVSYSVLGVLDASGAFVAYPGTEETVQIRGADYQAVLAPNASGKREGEFRTDDVRAAHVATRKE